MNAMSLASHSPSLRRAFVPDAENALVVRHGNLVRRIAHHLAARLPARVDVDDLVQAGMLGLTQAAHHFRAGQGVPFEAFAAIRIRGSMIDEIRRGDWAPRSVHRRARAAAEALRSIEQATGHEAAAPDVARALGLSLEEYGRLAADAVRAPVLSLRDGDDEPGAKVAAAHEDEPLPRLERDAFQDALAQAIGQLPAREREFMTLYYQEELTLREIGAVFGVSESRACQIHGQALLRLRGRLADWQEDA